MAIVFSSGKAWRSAAEETGRCHDPRAAGGRPPHSLIQTSSHRGRMVHAEDRAHTVTTTGVPDALDALDAAGSSLQSGSSKAQRDRPDDGPQPGILPAFFAQVVVFLKNLYNNMLYYGADILDHLRTLDPHISPHDKVMASQVVVFIVKMVFFSTIGILFVYFLSEFARSVGLKESKNASDQTTAEAEHGAESFSVMCPSLVVPHGSECVLAVPVCRAGESQWFITDKSGTPLFHVSAERRAFESVERISVATARERTLLGACELTIPRGHAHVAGERSSCSILNAQGQLYAQMHADTPLMPLGNNQVHTVHLVSSTATPIFVKGDFASFQMTVMDSAERPIAFVENGDTFRFERRGAEFYTLRVLSEADAGLVILSMLAIDRFPHIYAGGRVWRPAPGRYISGS